MCNNLGSAMYVLRFGDGVGDGELEVGGVIVVGVDIWRGGAVG